jgi:hypothetical protein
VGTGPEASYIRPDEQGLLDCFRIAAVSSQKYYGSCCRNISVRPAPRLPRVAASRITAATTNAARDERLSGLEARALECIATATECPDRLQG